MGGAPWVSISAKCGTHFYLRLLLSPSSEGDIHFREKHLSVGKSRGIRITQHRDFGIL